jgi:hypothetical protein
MLDVVDEVVEFVDVGVATLVKVVVDEDVTEFMSNKFDSISLIEDIRSSWL